MTEAQRLARQIVVGLVLVLIVGGLGFLFFRGFGTAGPTPTPDQTINLAPIRIISTKLFNIQNDDYDFLAKVRNANVDYGSGNVEYVLTFYDFSNREISNKAGSFYILPGQTKYLIDSPLSFQAPVSRADFKITGVDWQKLDPLAASGVSLAVRNAEYSQVSQPAIFAKVSGSIFNNSDFDLGQTDVTVVVLDENDEPIAVNKSKIFTFLARTTRGFEVSWIKSFVGRVARVDAEALTNVFENSNFLRSYGGQEKFKQQY